MVKVSSPNGKFFGIGFHRTGTRSLNHYFERLGLRSIHWVMKVDKVRYESLVIPHLNDRTQVVEVLAPVIEQYDAFTDVPFPGLYSELDQKYPNSRFILVTRNFETWWPSLKVHWKLGKKHFRALDPFECIQYNRHSDRDMRFVTLEDREHLRALLQKHTKSVQQYFAGRPESLLEVKLEDPGIASKISAFLGRPSEAAFPHLAKREDRARDPKPLGLWGKVLPHSMIQRRK